MMDVLACQVKAKFYRHRPVYAEALQRTSIAGLQKHFSPLGTKLYFHANFAKEKKMYCFDHQRGHLVTWLQTKNSIGSLPNISAGL